MFNKIKKRLNIIPNKSWDDITIKMFNQISDILDNKDEYTVLNLIDIIWGVSSADLKAADINKYISKLSFINDQPKKGIPHKHLVLNNRKYICDYNLPDISAAQFYDYQHYEVTNKLEDILSVFIYPEGHNYNDGYDMEQAKQDILEVPITEAIAACFFFEIQFRKYVSLFQHYLIKSAKKANMPKTAQALKDLPLWDLVSCHSLLNIVK